MKVGEPINIYDTVVIDYTTTTSSDSSLVEYDPLKTDYTTNDIVKVASERKKYKCASDVVAAGTTPSLNPSVWQSSPLVEYATFNNDTDYQTSIDGDFKFTIPDANGIDTLFFQGIDGDEVTVELLDGSDAVLDTLSDDIYDWDISSFGQYLFPENVVLKNKLQFDFLDLDIESIRVAMTGVTTKCRYFVACYKEDVGYTLWDGIGYNQNNFYTTERDDWGNLIDTNLRVVEDVTLPVLDYSDKANINVNRISRLFAKPNLWIADDRDEISRQMDFINIFGTLVSNNVVPGASVTNKTLNIWGK